MGYTHYWRPKADGLKNLKDKWGSVVQPLLLHIVSHFHAAGVIEYECDVPEAPQLDAECVRFNGVGDLGHETFYFSHQDRTDFEFCKTARKPYDTAVCACLLVLEHYGPIGLSSDGLYARGASPGSAMSNDILVGMELEDEWFAAVNWLHENTPLRVKAWATTAKTASKWGNVSIYPVLWAPADEKVLEWLRERSAVLEVLRGQMESALFSESR